MVLSERLNNLYITVTRKEEGAMNKRSYRSKGKPVIIPKIYRITIPHYPLHLRFLESKSQPLIKAFHECESSLVILVMGLHMDNAIRFYVRMFYKILKIFSSN